MKKFIPVAVFLAFVLGLIVVKSGGGRAPIPPGFNPTTTIDSAHSAAQADGKPILVFATADWCGPCQAFKRGTLSTKGVTQALQNKVHAVYLDIDKSAQQANEMNLSGVPTLILYDKTGKEIRRRVGGMSESELLAFLTP